MRCRKVKRRTRTGRGQGEVGGYSKVQRRRVKKEGNYRRLVSGGCSNRDGWMDGWMDGKIQSDDGQYEEQGGWIQYLILE